MADEDVRLLRIHCKGVLVQACALKREQPMSSSGITRRKLFETAAVGAAASIAGFSFPRPAIAQIAKVRYTLSWLPTGQYAFIYSARQLGYFKKRGIDLDIS